MYPLFKATLITLAAMAAAAACSAKPSENAAAPAASAAAVQNVQNATQTDRAGIVYPAQLAEVEPGKIYSEAHRLSIGKHMEKVRYNNNGIEMVANIYYSENFDRNKKYSAIVVGHPGGGVKEQAAGPYARLLAEKGFVAIAFDASKAAACHAIWKTPTNARATTPLPSII